MNATLTTAFQTFGNPQVAALPDHLKKYIVDQHYENYTPADHALWRYVMRQNYSYLKDAAYYPYIPGLRMAGLTIEKIPSLQEMNDALGQIGWGAVTVDGFIPPAAFMEYQARRVLVIAADIRTLEHIEYTPAPDIIHESAGHAPIISDTKYNQYLSYLGYVGTKALYTSRDYALYESIRQLSILKEMPHVDEQAVKEAEAQVLVHQQNLGEPSEMALLSRLQWWTVEYGLIGPLDDPKIYGAGLLSSIGESAWCMRPEVKKLPYTIDAVNYSYDITKPQPQLFVTHNFQNLIDVLKQFEEGMAWRKGGVECVHKAIEGKNVCTVVFDSGVQVSGIFTRVEKDQEGNAAWMETTGKTSLSMDDQVLKTPAVSMFPNGFLLLPGRFKGIAKDPWDCSTDELGLQSGRKAVVEISSGIRISGSFDKAITSNGKLLVLEFTEVTITDTRGQFGSEQTFVQFSLVMGTRITSVFNGAADRSVFEESVYVSEEVTKKLNFTTSDKAHHALFRRVRMIRESGNGIELLSEIWKELKRDHPQDWLCALEIVELTVDQAQWKSLYEEVRVHLDRLAEEVPAYTKLIRDGLSIVDSKLIFA